MKPLEKCDSDQALTILNHLHEHGENSADNIAHKTGLTYQQVKRSLRTLKDRGLVKHRPNVLNHPNQRLWDTDYVIVSANYQSKKYHNPDPDNPGKPACFQADLSDKWVRKSSELADHWDLCKNCGGTVEKPKQQRSLSSKLEQMDPSEV